MNLIERLRDANPNLVNNFVDCNALMNEAADELERSYAHEKKLMERLEMWPVILETGEWNKAILLDESTDGIACRDETIRQLDANIKRKDQRIEHFEIFRDLVGEWLYDSSKRQAVQDEYIALSEDN